MTHKDSLLSLTAIFLLIDDVDVALDLSLEGYFL